MIKKKNFKNIADKYKISLIVLFGSYAKGRITITSDNDIAVWAKSKEIDELNLLYDFVNLYQGEKVDLLILNKADPLSQYEVASSGIPLHEDNEGLFRHFQVFAMKRNDDGRKFRDLDKVYIDRYLKGEYTYERPRCNPPKIGKDGRISYGTRTYYKS